MKLLSLWKNLFGDQKSVLIVDDELHIREELGETLRVEKYQVFTAASISEARTILKQHQPDFIIIDLNLDNTSEYGGIVLFIEVHREYPKIKPIILSAYWFEQLEENEKFIAEIEGKIELETMKHHYVSKGGEGNYIPKILEKLKEPM